MRKSILNFCSFFGIRRIIPFLKLFFRGNPIFFIPTDQKTCFLTIDDGPGNDENINKSLLDLFKKYDVKATFFMIGCHINENSKVFIENLIKDGHELANHMQNNEPAHLYSKEKFEQELMECEQKLQLYDRELCKKATKLFRPPYGKISKIMVEILKKKNYKTVLGDLYSFDYHIDDAEFHKNYFKKNIQKGAIIILHFPEKDKNFQTLQILNEIIPNFKKEGYKFSLLRKFMEDSKLNEK